MNVTELRMEDDVLDQLVRIALRCERAAQLLDSEPLNSQLKRLSAAIDEVGEAWSGSWLGYHSSMYLDGFRIPMPGEMFDPQWGTTHGYPVGRTRGPWRQYGYDHVVDEILRRAGVEDTKEVNRGFSEGRKDFDQSKEEFLPILDALISEANDPVLIKIRDETEALQSFVLQKSFVEFPQSFFTNDHQAVSQGIKAPPHISFQAWLMQQSSPCFQIAQLEKLVRRTERYLVAKYKMKGKTVAKTQGKVFIGHGRGSDWQELALWLTDRPKLQYDHFNRYEQAGLTTIHRLEEMLADAVFAILILTAEDEQADGTMRARQNVVHEAGLFQGRLGFNKAILLVDDQCVDFSNVEGLTHIKFTRGKIRAVFENVRGALEREGIL
jgi:predicted nucleotide-binding protein